jgi:hypothetical protein
MIKIILSALILNGALFAIDDMAKKVKTQNQEIVQLAAKEISSQLPQKIDDFTQLVKLEGVGQTLVYTYEINTGSKSDETVINEDKSRMKKAVTQGICKSSERFLTSGIDISYIYASAKSKKELFRFDVSREDCVKK